MSKQTKEIEFVVSYDAKLGKTTYYDYRFKGAPKLIVHGKPLTDKQIDDLLPEADGTAEEVKRKVEYRPGMWADEVGIDDAWSKSLVIEIIRAVEKHHGIGFDK